MKEIIYQTEQECLAAKQLLESMGMEIPEWLTSQITAFAEERTKKKQAIDETYIWGTLQAHYPYGVMPEEKKKCVEETVAKLLETGAHAEDPCLLLGKIQCGKTDTFEDIIGLSFDKGVDIAIVITKGTKALVSQTIKRMSKDFSYFKETDDLDQKATIKIYDIMDIWQTGLRKATVETSKTVIVCKKNAANLDHLIELFNQKNPFLIEKKVLIVDDEADFASRNYLASHPKSEVDEDGSLLVKESTYSMAKISQQIDDFRKIPSFCRYLQVTATPYCLYLQPKGELNLSGNTVKAFRPRFTSLVPVHDAYIGGKQYFVDSQESESMYSHLFHPVSDTCLRVLGREDKRYLNTSIASKNLYDLTYALIAYFMAAAIRRIQVKETKRKDYKTSAILHVEVDKKNHDWERRIINRLINDIKQAIVEEDHSDQRIWTAIDLLYEDFSQSNAKGRAERLISIELPEKEDVLDEIRNIFNPLLDNFLVQMVNSDEQMSSLLDPETGELKLETAATIFVGGNILDRGVTIKNMLCFFYGRDPGNFQQDTVLQHARMYGARSKEDMAVTRFHTTNKIHKILVRMNDLDEQLRNWFVEGKDQLEPNAVFVGFDSNIKPCAASKIKISNAIALKSQHRMLPVGFWPEKNFKTRDIYEKVTKLLTSSPNYCSKDANGFFEVDKNTVMKCLRLVESSFVFDTKQGNLAYKNELKELLCALEYCCEQSGDKVYVLHREGRELSRFRADGGFINAPDDGRSDIKPSKEKAQDAPVVMFIGQKGAKNREWDGIPFYWPVLITQNDLNPVMFSIDVNKRKKISITADCTEILDGIDPTEVLTLEYSGNLKEMYGEVGTDYSYEYCENAPRHSVVLKETTASKYIFRTEDGDWSFNPAIEIDKTHADGLYSLNRGKFPFVLKPYKYILVKSLNYNQINLMLLELKTQDQWKIFNAGLIDEEGYLCVDKNGKLERLVLAKDVLVDKNLEEVERLNEYLAAWAVIYPINKVLRYQEQKIKLVEPEDNSSEDPDDEYNF